MLNCIMSVETVIPSLSHATKDGQNTLRTVICVMSWPEPVIPFQPSKGRRSGRLGLSSLRKME
ncbi:Site-specific recombinase [Granulibacter bethesdensis]|uniref:Site-specific recombinase n=1 Tax=Granulibacter bethesdensis TaxID=364410 RepID=A0AAC9P8B6_9PROT|nr:Site-specific recombinase [Granulibacter bethesdensis]APH61932.1 Site-specific recombinase [Granulibacter bethesdensis]